MQKVRKQSYINREHGVKRPDSDSHQAAPMWRRLQADALHRFHGIVCTPPGIGILCADLRD
jgi:hypothetical protein